MRYRLNYLFTPIGEFKKKVVELSDFLGSASKSTEKRQGLGKSSFRNAFIRRKGRGRFPNLELPRFSQRLLYTSQNKKTTGINPVYRFEMKKVKSLKYIKRSCAWYAICVGGRRKPSYTGEKKFHVE